MRIAHHRASRSTGDRHPAGAAPLTQRSGRPRLSRVSIAGIVLAGLAVLIAVFGFCWRVTGGHWEVVATPSMGRTAPVGSLVFTRPAEVAAVRIGEVVSYHPPGPRAETITHRVVRLDDNGMLHTRGDINAAEDAWPVGNDNLVGRVVSIWWGFGWLLRALPLLIIGGLIIWWATKLWVAPRWRGPLRVFGSSVVISVIAIVLKPFVGMMLLSTTADDAGTHATLVSTGMLPIRISAGTGGSVDLVDGQVGVLTTQLANGTSGTKLSAAVHLSFLGWIIAIGLWLIPLLVGLIADRLTEDGRFDTPGGGPPETDGSNGPEQPAQPDAIPVLAAPVTAAAPTTASGDPAPSSSVSDRPRGRAGRHRQAAASRLGPWAASALVLITAAIAGTGGSTSAALVARINNTSNTAATAAKFFTCASATSAIGTANTVFTYPLSDAAVTAGSTADDLSANSRDGLYSANFSKVTSRPCPRDSTSTAVTSAPNTQAFVYPKATTAQFSLVVFSEVIWFRTTTTTGGRLIGWGNSYNGTSSAIDRHIFLNSPGNLVFGVYTGSTKTVVSPKAYNDGNWHQAVATLSGAGMRLYADGALVASDPTTTTAEGGTGGRGWWRVGYDNLNGWGNVATNNLTGNLAWASVFSTALSTTQVTNLYNAGT